ncbi:MAG: hypothetical protein ACI9K5_000778, partial [Gammaproteobacteria bacterium]
PGSIQHGAGNRIPFLELALFVIRMPFCDVEGGAPNNAAGPQMREELERMRGFG